MRFERSKSEKRGLKSKTIQHSALPHVEMATVAKAREGFSVIPALDFADGVEVFSGGRDLI